MDDQIVDTLFLGVFSSRTLNPIKHREGGYATPVQISDPVRSEQPRSIPVFVAHMALNLVLKKCQNDPVIIKAHPIRVCLLRLTDVTSLPLCIDEVAGSLKADIAAVISDCTGLVAKHGQDTTASGMLAIQQSHYSNRSSTAQNMSVPMWA